MRLQLIIGFVVIISIVLFTSWLLAVQTTVEEFDVLVSAANQQQAQWLAPSLLKRYEELGDWSAVQEVLVEEMDERENAFSNWRIQFDGNGPLMGDGVISLQVQGESSNFDAILDGVEVFDLDDTFTYIPLRPDFATPSDRLEIAESTLSFYMVSPERPTVFFNAPDLSWITSSIQLTDQRILILDGKRVVVDTHRDLIGRRLTTTENGIPLYSSNPQELVGTLLVTPEDGVYTVQQTAFLEQVQQGLLLSGAISGALAIFLALIFANRATRPIRLLTTAATRIRAGEWGYQVHFRGRTEIGQLAQAFDEMSAHLAEQRHLRVRLVDDLAHELNTPISLMRLELQAMADGLQSPTEAAEHLSQELTEVSELVDDLIFLASRDSAPTPQMDWLDLNSLVTNAIRRFEGSAAQNRTLYFEATENLAPIYGDAYLIQRAISNLISNALRYTPQDGNIRLETQQTEGTVAVVITDTGEGIPAEHLPHIFERFYRADHSRTRQTGGRGLGLAIVKQIMEQHQGDIQVRSQIGKGSVFTLSWPAVGRA